MGEEPEGTPEHGNSPDPAAAAAEQVDWQKRFTDTQAAFTRSQQELATLQRLANGEDPEALKAVLDKYGYAIEDDDDPEPDPDPAEQPDLAALRKELADLKAAQETSGKTLAEINAERAQAAFNTDLKAAVGDREISDKAREWIETRTMTTGNNGEALAAAVKDWFEFEDSLRSKPRPRAPHVPTGKAPTGGKEFKDMTRQEREAWQIARLQAEAAQ